MNLTIVGIAPAGFNYPNGSVLWKAASLSPGNQGWKTLGRLRPGVSPQQATEALRMEDSREPNVSPAIRAKYPAGMMLVRDSLAGPVKSASTLLIGGVALILLLACANVANLLLARTADRFSELAIRSALGASRVRIVQQLLTESILLSLTAAAAGLGAAVWTVGLVSKVQPAPLASQAYSILDVRVLLFAIAVSICAGVIFGCLPAFHAGRAETLNVRGATGTWRSKWIREGLVAVQVGLTIVLLASSVSIGRSFLALTTLDRGYDTEHVATVSVALQGTTRQAGALGYFDEALEQLRRIPGVRSATATDFLPLDASMFLGGPATLDGRRASENAMIVPVMADYFQTVGGHVLFGREISEAEVRGDVKVAVVSERFAREFGPPEDALGHRVALGRRDTRTVVGVVKEMDYAAGIFDANSMQIFVPASAPGAFYPTFAVRVNGDAEIYLKKIQDAVQSVDAQVPVFGAKTMGERLELALLRPKFYNTVAACFAGFAVMLAVMGIYGLVSYAVSQRQQEMGIRLALGTTSLNLRARALGQGLLPVAIGCIPGIVLAIFAGRLVESLMQGARPIDVGMSMFSAGLVLMVASASIWIATRRIEKLDVMDILRRD
jgi:putative ABC transport system permease protein